MNTIVRILILLACIPAWMACRSTNGLTLNVNEPAPIWMPPHLKKVGIIGRTQPSDQTRAIDKVDQVLSIEGTRLDKEGARESIRGLAADLEKNNRFLSVKQLDKPELTGPGMDVFPAPLAWETVAQICQENQLDALFVLEFFDTNSKINYSAIPITINGPLGVKVPAVEHQATMLTSIKTGWRIYDPQNKVIIDQHPMSRQMTSVGKGINPVAAATALLERKEAVKQTSYQIGQVYASSLLPYQIRVWREYYVRGTDSFKVGKRRAQTGNWAGAAELWERETQHPKNKVAGRACYNMAISSEINGNLDQAIEWAGRSYTDYKNRLALRYLNVLKQRKAHVQEIERRQAADSQQ
ncbi:DUF6340 family protein [Xanthocytophaga agilis]|uniref:DUF6340 family protein n=1 Tax=Xanthocytophaga agilis TaxID=3048010 RepID=A0AAE3UFU3_9BACT|nr:DUF6340 family protein [Xanthocytophaga agilis]MDJ1504223.1 DUF6340 family protein [Xanthocytophaga agilis]